MLEEYTPENGFKPMLYPNDSTDVEDVKYPQLASYKLDGIRCLFINGNMVSRQSKYFRNPELTKRFQPLIDFSREHHIILDGELYDETATFQEIGSCTSKEGQELPDTLFYYAFDMLEYDADANAWKTDVGALERIERLKGCKENYFNDYPFFGVLVQSMVYEPEQVNLMFESARMAELEGLILKHPDSMYKFGRVTTKSGDGYKLKEWRTEDAIVKDIVQATKVDPNAEKKMDVFGYSKTSRKKADRIPIEKAAGFIVEYNGNDFTVSLAGTDKFKKEVWKNKSKYIGHYIEYKFQPDGVKNVPRFPVFLRMRPDKDE